MNKKTAQIFLAILIAHSVGCDNDLINHNQDNNMPVELDLEAAKEAYLATRSNNDTLKTFDEILADIALKVPGYGGHFIDDDGNLNVYLLSNQEREAIKSVFRQHHRAGVLTAGDDLLSDLRSRQGQYNFLQLYNWKAELRSSGVLGIKGVTLLDINEAQNNITLGVKDLVHKEKVFEKVRQIGIPESAINIIERDPVEYNIRSKRTTLAGGLQIRYIVGSSTYTCTLGPVALRNGVKGFIVNSHCTATRFTVDNEKFYQAKPSDRHIATETVDPPYFTGGDCPPSRRCAYADAAFAEWKHRGTWNLGRIYKTEYSGHLNGSTHRVGASFIINRKSHLITVGTLVQKVGRTTGWTYGDITRTCVDGNVYQSNITMLCQYAADYGNGSGDSGAPVFQRATPITNDVYLSGINWGTNGIESFFSDISFVDNHLGDTINYY